MILKSIKYCRFEGQKQEWAMEGKSWGDTSGQAVTFENINLVVGKNATGKSKTVDVIRGLADLLTGRKISDLNYNTSIFDVLFEHNETEIKYYLNFKDGKIVSELLTIDGMIKINRSAAIGQLYYEEAKKDLNFQIEDEKLAASKVDNLQHPFLMPLYDWGKNLNHYRFGGDLGKHSWLRDVNAVKIDEEVDLKNSKEVTEIFVKASLKFGDAFTEQILADMAKISYPISTILTEKIKLLPITAFGLGVQEFDREDTTDQREMSQGMFRALSLIVQINYALLSKTSSCILIDDIGEGLDFERSKSLIDLIIEKVNGSPVQIIMTTNDRFVMNKIPLEYWSVIQRLPKKSIFYNYRNSKETFDEFKYTGLSNFDFLSSEFYAEGFTSDDQQANEGGQA